MILSEIEAAANTILPSHWSASEHCGLISIFEGDDPVFTISVEGVVSRLVDFNEVHSYLCEHMTPCVADEWVKMASQYETDLACISNPEPVEALVGRMANEPPLPMGRI